MTCVRRYKLENFEDTLSGNKKYKAFIPLLENYVLKYIVLIYLNQIITICVFLKVKFASIVYKKFIINQMSPAEDILTFRQTCSANAHHLTSLPTNV